MKKYLFRILVGFLAFGAGVFGVWMLISKVKFKNYCTATLTPNSAIKDEQTSKKLNGKIEVHFKQLIETKDGNAFQFLVENNTNENISYSSYQLKEESFVMFPLYEVKVDAEKINKMWCGTGLMTYQLKSGESKIFQIYVGGVVHPWKKGKDLQVGFNFKKESKNFIKVVNYDYQTVWSDNLANSDENIKLLVKEKIEFDRQIKN